MKSDLVDLSLALHHGTGRAILVSETGDAKKAVWLALSLIEFVETGKIVKGETANGQAINVAMVTVTLPEWLAIDKGAGMMADRKIAKARKLIADGVGERAVAREIGLSRHQVRKLFGRAGTVSGGGDAPLAPMTAPVDDIVVGKRTRRDFGDIASLARSIDANGLLHPVVVRRHPGYRGVVYELIAGERRLGAWRQSRFRDDPIPIRIIDLASVMRGEWAENHERKDFTPSETVAIKRALEVEFDLKGSADKRKKVGKKATGDHVGEANEIVAAYAGKSRRTIEKAEKVVEAAERDPKRFGFLKDQMDKSGKADGPFRRLQNIEAGDRIKAAPPGMPLEGPYRTIVIDPPWIADLDGYRNPETRGYYPYKTMTLEQIAEIDIPSLANNDGCALWLWITNFHLARGCQVLLFQKWGFKASTILTWCKPKMGQGQRLRGATEHCVLAVRGNVPILGASTRTWFEAPAGQGHSAKPPNFYRIIEEVTPAVRYAYLFAGKDWRQDWDMHGDRLGIDAVMEKEILPPRSPPGDDGPDRDAQGAKFGAGGEENSMRPGICEAAP